MNKNSILVTLAILVASLIALFFTSCGDGLDYSILSSQSKAEASHKAEAFADLFNGKKFVVSGKSDSMGEIIPHPSYIVTEKDWGKIKVGLVVVVDWENKKVVHRIIKKTNRGYITKGDKNKMPDKILLTKENYIGTLVSIIPFHP